ncbi:AlwI family type II restriction endonuclease [Prevotella sp. E13-17]|uniref:AlwI family type II restriction endonuclease n=1 Tax=Prevotella sp. E13-17 TaxID=2913616 RepID=UPI001EDBC939|nr:AlwI family type II restriction endonuclease [Prevotella sp. E13-17]UKK50087.1 AlwI family type II restriction endonuclease [Prevotella sp. E13-17]
MSRKVNPEYKPLLYTTTMRNPGRLKFMLYVLNMFEGQILNDELATKICGETIRYGLFRPTKRICDIIKQKWSTTPKGEFAEYALTDYEVQSVLDNNDSTQWDDIKGHKEAGFAKGWPSRFATIYDLTKELGLAYYWPGEPIIISQLAHHLLSSFTIEVDPASGFVVCKITHPEYEQQVFLQAMAKSQRMNPFVRVLNDNIPLILLLETIKKLNADPQQNGCGISRRELPLLIFWKNNDSQSLYQRIVKLRKEHRYDPSDEVVCDICLKEIMEGNFKEFDTKSIMVDYPDEFIRKMRLTGLLSLRGAGRFLDINKNEIEKVDYILSHYSLYHHFDDERAYFDYMAELDTNLIKITSHLPSATASEKLLDNWLSVYNWNIIKKELTNLATRKNSTDNVLKLLAAPTRLEFLTALAIRCRMPDVRVVPNYSCDDEGLPTSTAGGNKGDIECYEQQNGVLVEVTMAIGRAQTMMEVWPIERHLEDFQKKQQSQCIFVAPSIYIDSLRQINYVSADSKGKIKIRPYDIPQLLIFLEQTPSLYEHKITSLFESPALVSYADELMRRKNGIGILALSVALQELFGKDYASMGAREWYVVVRKYVEHQTMRQNIPDNEPVMWMAAEDAPLERL